jgi:hypothetical protein
MDGIIVLSQYNQLIESGLDRTRAVPLALPVLIALFSRRPIKVEAGIFEAGALT